MAIARFKESGDRLRSALSYLEKPAIVFPSIAASDTGNDWTTLEGRQRYQRRDYLMRNYGVSLEQFEWLLTEQEQNCAICRDALPEGRGRHVDHDHVTGRVRGVLCNDCNVGLGQAKDSPAVLASAIAYLRQSPLA